MHSGLGLTVDSSLRTHALALNAQTQKKLALTHVNAGAYHIDEYSQLRAELNNAAAVRTTHARREQHALDIKVYYRPQERYGRISTLTYSGDHLQLPPVPATSSVLAAIDGTSKEHRAGASIFRNAELVFEFQQAMRFTDATLIGILESMRTPGGKTLTSEQWQSLLRTQLSAAQPDVPPGWYHSCYCWSVTTMASYMVARQSANRCNQPLIYVQAIDEPKSLMSHTNTRELYKEMLAIPSLSQTKRLPGVVLFHHGMRMRLTATIQQPFAVQDVECTVVGFDHDPADGIRSNLRADSQSEMRCTRLPKAIYVKLDECDHTFLPPGTCTLHRTCGHDANCEDCVSAVQPGVFAVKPLSRTWQYYPPDSGGKYIPVTRHQFPLMPVEAVPLYSMQGTTADPGLVAYWMFPLRCTKTIQWLIVYVTLSRPRSLSQLKSVNLTKKIREIIEGGPPDDLVQAFRGLFAEKIEATRKLAEDAARQYGLLEGLI